MNIRRFAFAFAAASALPFQSTFAEGKDGVDLISKKLAAGAAAAARAGKTGEFQWLSGVARDCDRIIAFHNKNQKGLACQSAGRVACLRGQLQEHPPTASPEVELYLTEAVAAALSDGVEMKKMSGQTAASTTCATCYYAEANLFDALLSVTEAIHLGSFFIFKYAPQSDIDARSVQRMKKSEQTVVTKVLSGVEATIKSNVLVYMEKTKRDCGASPCTATETSKRQTLERNLLARYGVLAQNTRTALSSGD